MQFTSLNWFQWSNQCYEWIILNSEMMTKPQKSDQQITNNPERILKVKTLMTRTISSKNHFEFLFYAFISFYLLLVLESFYTDGAAAVSEQRRRRKSVAHLASPPSHNRTLLVNHPLDTRIPIRLTLSAMSRTTRESSRCFEMLQVFVTHLRGRFDAARHHQKKI